MASRAERKRRRRAAQAKVEDRGGSWVVFHPSRGGTVARFAAAVARMKAASGR